MNARSFRQKVWRHYRKNRRTFPWRQTKNPYRILVSEVMLQQTQADRVIPYYRNFLKQFPSLRPLARARQRDVLSVWSGLGYNRRARYLHSAAQRIIADYDGKIPRENEALTALPGIGSATAAAIRAFAFNLPGNYLDTNVRSVFLHEFFPRQRDVHDREILPLLERTMNARRPREWYYALLDYGAYLKRTGENPSRRSRHHVRQKPFRGSDRKLRGEVVRLLISKPRTAAELVKLTGSTVPHSVQVLQALVKDGLVRKLTRSGTVRYAIR